MGFHQPIPRFYFYLVKDDEVISDTTGVVIPDFESALPAYLEAIQRTLRELRQEGSYTGDWDGWQLQVVAPSGDALLTICLGNVPTHD